MEAAKLLGDTFQAKSGEPLHHSSTLESDDIELVLVELPRDIEPKLLKHRKISLLDSVTSCVTLDSVYECEVSTQPEGIPQAVMMFPDKKGRYRPIKPVSGYVKLMKKSEPLLSARSNTLRTSPREQPGKLGVKWQGLEAPNRLAR
jgi:hypothetical protein